MQYSSPNKENINPLSKTLNRRSRSLIKKLETQANPNAHMSFLKNFEITYNLDEAFTQHFLTERIRAKLVDWMIEVLNAFKSAQRTLFLAVKLLDIYISNSNGLVPLDLHIIGMTSMFMASKYEDIKPLTLQIVFEKIGHKKVSKANIVAMEKDILNVVNYNIYIPTLYDFLEYLVENSDENVNRLA